MSNGLTQEKALIFRITHRNNVEWILDNGFHCANAKTKDPNFVAIGNSDLIMRRASRSIEIGPGGTLKDYVPFYFTPYSPMLYNIKTGYGGIKQRDNEDIVIFVSSLHSLSKQGVDFVFSDRHAYLETAEFYSDILDLDKVDWGILQARDFRRDPNDPGKIERYQAEALAFGDVPVKALLGLICYNKSVHKTLQTCIRNRDLNLELHIKPRWYF